MLGGLLNAERERVVEIEELSRDESTPRASNEKACASSGSRSMAALDLFRRAVGRVDVAAGVAEQALGREVQHCGAPSRPDMRDRGARFEEALLEVAALRRE